jgi:tetratricopeptide (TPR) repeat protein
MGKGPLDHPRLLAIEERLDRGELEEAQRLLAALGDVAFFRYATGYLATRLLFERGRLDGPAVAQRLKDILRSAGFFPEADAMLAAAEAGTLSRGSTAYKHEPPVAASNPRLATPAVAAALRSDVEMLFESNPSAPPPLPSIPRAPQLPYFSAPPDPTPSYAPDPTLPAESIPPLVAPSAPPIAPIPAIEISAEPTPTQSKPAPEEGAGRYSEAPQAPEILRPSSVPPARRAPSSAPPPRRAPSSVPPPERVPSDRPVRSGAPPELFGAGDGLGLAPRIRSGVPPPPETQMLPTVLELAALLDQERFDEAIRAIDGAGPELSPDHVLMRSRALIGAGRPEEALEVLERLGCAPLLDPEVRATVARALLDVGSPELALDQARKAHEDDAEAPLVKITLAWSAVRVGRRSADAVLFGEADSLLFGIKSRADPMPALVLALRASVQSEIGDPERALVLAQRALQLDPRLPDALSAVSLASAQLGRVHDARQAWVRLHQTREDEAQTLRSRLEAQGISVAESLEAAGLVSQARPPWDPIELALLRGKRRDATDAFELACKERLAQLAGHGTDQDLPVIATVGASLLTTSPITHHFAPYDFSLWSLARVDAALALLYRGEARLSKSDDFPVLMLIGAYVGESLRQAHDGRWLGSLSGLEDARVVGEGGEWMPFRALKARIRSGARLDLGTAGTALAHPGTEPWSYRTHTPLAPPCLWDPAPWPKPASMSDLAKAFADSVVSVYAKELASGPLDFSLPSLASLDAYLALIAPPRAPAPDVDLAWVRRGAALSGAYLGETVRAAVGGAWIEPAGTEADASSYAVVFGDEYELTPVLDVLDRISGDTKASLLDHATRFIRKLE